jgi:hypothetical protein
MAAAEAVKSARERAASRTAEAMREAERTRTQQARQQQVTRDRRIGDGGPPWPPFFSLYEGGEAADGAESGWI